MAEPETRLFCCIDGLTPAEREQKRLSALRKLGLLTVETVGVFEEATQTATRFLDAPICILGFMTKEQLQIKSAVGLSTFGLMNQLAKSRRLPRQESFCTYVVDAQKILAISDTATNPVFASSLLVGYYGIRAYLGAPLLTADGQCLGALAVMDLVPRCFTTRDLDFLAITARWSLSEFERNLLLKEKLADSVDLLPESTSTTEYSIELKADSTASKDVLTDGSGILSSTNSIKVKLLTQLTQQMRTPLTSVMGMSSVLSRQIYGPLTEKQQEYLKIIYDSGQHLVSLVEEIVTLSLLDETTDKLDLIAVDLEMLCQKVINSLSEMARQLRQKMRLSVAPGNRIWPLDKDKVRQLLYYLVFSLINSAEPDSEIRIHVSRKNDGETFSTMSLQIAVWVSHPWLGEGLPKRYGELVESFLVTSPSKTTAVSALTPKDTSKAKNSEPNSRSYPTRNYQILSSSSLWTTFTMTSELSNTQKKNDSLEILGLLLSCHLAELQGGHVAVQGSSALGYRYVVSLPQAEEDQQE
ncbi:histidine kinase dimerization/phospho-acceptor domain-containing protein [Lyngbya aestuarii]|uniref:histidine kinase dimerization/phospho-acceptor domain-containing protein n=1 Tax=Lyngbya aestuarii TaxID=118322 RepID=UPI00403D7E2A